VSELVRLDKQGPLAWVTIDRPEVMNALSYPTLGRLGEIVAELSQDQQVRVVLITGAGEKAFCAGADLKERVAFDDEQTRAFVTRIGDTFSAVASLPQPTIAVINGVAYGGGLELALACDLRVSASHAKMGLTETSLAIIPGAGGTQRLPAVVGIARAKQMILTAERVDAQQAAAMGLVNDVVPSDELRAAAKSMADAIAACGPLAVRAAKEAIDLSTGQGDLASNLMRERALYLERVLHSKDRIEALNAFREKRSPEYTGE
jgi:enoyl-CoA hydratase/carnithine racemase